MSFQQFTRSRPRSAFSALAKSLVTVLLVASSCAIGITPAHAATSIVWDGSNAVCLKVSDGGILLSPQRFFLPPDYEVEVNTIGTYAESESGVVFEFGLTPEYVAGLISDDYEYEIRMVSTNDCPWSTGVVNWFACFTVSSNTTVEMQKVVNFVAIPAELDTPHDVVQGDSGTTLVFVAFTFDSAPTSNATITLTLGKTESDCGASEDDGGDDNNEITRPRFDFSLDSYMQRVTATGLPDTL